MRHLFTAAPTHKAYNPVSVREIHWAPSALWVPLVSAVWVPLVSAVVLSSVLPPMQPAQAAAVMDRVTRVVDGDTLITESAGRVRLIGMNTPETVSPAQRQGAPPQCFGPEASAETKRLLPEGTQVRLETDQEPTDKYGRRLAYVFR